MQDLTLVSVQVIAFIIEHEVQHRAIWQRRRLVEDEATFFDVRTQDAHTSTVGIFSALGNAPARRHEAPGRRVSGGLAYFFASVAPRRTILTSKTAAVADSGCGWNFTVTWVLPLVRASGTAYSESSSSVGW